MSPRPVTESVEPIGTEPAAVNTAGAVQPKVPCRFAADITEIGAPALMRCAVMAGDAVTSVSGYAPCTKAVPAQVSPATEIGPALVSNVTVPPSEAPSKCTTRDHQ